MTSPNDTPPPAAPSGDKLTILWDDRRIDSEMRMIGVTDAGSRLKYYVWESTFSLFRQMRDSYEAKLDEYQAAYIYYIELAEKNEAALASLRAQLAAQSEWTPVEDGIYYPARDGTIELGKDNTLLVTNDVGHVMYAHLDAEFRLCRLRTPAAPGTGAEGEAQ